MSVYNLIVDCTCLFNFKLTVKHISTCIISCIVNCKRSTPKQQGSLNPKPLTTHYKLYTTRKGITCRNVVCMYSLICRFIPITLHCMYCNWLLLPRQIQLQSVETPQAGKQSTSIIVKTVTAFLDC